MKKYDLSQIMGLLKSNNKQVLNIEEIIDIHYENNDQVDFETCQGGMQNLKIIFSNKVSHLDLILKVCSEESSLASINALLRIFEKEISFYRDILPFFYEYEKKFVSKKLFQNLFVKFYGAGSIDKDVIIILRRFSEKYVVFPRENFLRSLDEIQCVLKSLAIFHASSYAVKCKSQVNVKEKFPTLKDFLFDYSSNDVFFSLTNHLYRSNIKLLKAIVEDSQYKNNLGNQKLLIKFSHSIISRLESLSSKIVVILHNIQLGKDETNLLCHGDFHMWNIAYSKNLKKVKFFDFQLIRLAPCMTDFHQYLCQVSSPSFRRSQLTGLIRLYSETFQEVCQQYGIDQDCFYNETWFLEEYRVTSPWGFLFGFLFNLKRFVPTDFYNVLDKLNNNDEIIEYLLAQKSKEFWDMISFYLDSLCELEEQDVISIMESLQKEY